PPPATVKAGATRDSETRYNGKGTACRTLVSSNRQSVGGSPLELRARRRSRSHDRDRKNAWHPPQRSGPGIGAVLLSVPDHWRLCDGASGWERPVSGGFPQAPPLRHDWLRLGHRRLCFGLHPAFASPAPGVSRRGHSLVLRRLVRAVLVADALPC